MPITFIKASGNLIDQAAQLMEPRLRAAFLRAVDAFKGTINEDALNKAVASGDVNGVMAVLALDEKFVDALNGKGITGGVESFRDAIQAAFASGSKAAIRALPSRVSLNLSFDLMSKEAQAFLEGYSFPLIRQISSNTADGIRAVILDAFKNGGHPYEQARIIRTMIGLTTNQAQAVRNYRLSLMSTGTANQTLNRALRDARFDPTIRRATNNGVSLTPKQVDAMTTRYSERYLKYRAEAIARTESVRASNKGQRESWRQAVKQGLLSRDQKREWEISGDDRTCPECEALDGRVVGLDEEFEPGVLDPPDPHTTCRCSTKLVFPKAA
jgi:SPP1 gp7 family putative phage head morphogenesis protein